MTSKSKALKHSYLFLLRLVVDEKTMKVKPNIDSFYDVSLPEELRGDGVVEAVFAARELTGVDLLQDYGHYGRAFTGMSMRARFNPNDMRGPLLVHSDVPLTFDDLQRHVEGLKGKKLQDFIQASKI
jgi:hypothetical protein